MTAQTTDTSVTTSILVEAPIDKAFSVFSWDVSLQWQLETDHSRTSEVEVRFLAEGPARTRVELEHRNLDRHFDGWEGMRGAVGAPDGWGDGLRRFADRMAVG